MAEGLPAGNGRYMADRLSKVDLSFCCFVLITFSI